MAHIELNNELPGIRGLMVFRPETEKPLNLLAETLLRDETPTLSRGQRELIATYVSYLNDCFFCQNVHGAMAGHYLGCSMEHIEDFKRNFDTAGLDPRMKALLSIAAGVQKSGKLVTSAQIGEARKYGASDIDIHDTVLIAAAFCMFNRYVDGLATWCPADRQVYWDRAPQTAAGGYHASVFK